MPCWERLVWQRHGGGGYFDSISCSEYSSHYGKHMVGEAVLIASHVVNIVPIKNNEITPYEGLKGRKPSIHYMWGCLAMVSVPIYYKKCKLEPKTVNCILLGYAHHSTTYKFLVIKSDTCDILVDSLIES
jgi:hypothetical protein